MFSDDKNNTESTPPPLESAISPSPALKEQAEQTDKVPPSSVVSEKIASHSIEKIKKKKPVKKKPVLPLTSKEKASNKTDTSSVPPKKKEKPKAKTTKQSSKSPKPKRITKKAYKEQKKIEDLTKELEYLNSKSQETILIKNAEGRYYCQVENCDQPAVTDFFCRYHYLSDWPYIYQKKTLLKEKYLLKTIQELIKEFGESALSFIMQDCKNERAFELATKEMSFMVEQNKHSSNSESDTDVEY